MTEGHPYQDDVGTVRRQPRSTYGNYVKIASNRWRHPVTGDVHTNNDVKSFPVVGQLDLSTLYFTPVGATLAHTAKEDPLVTNLRLGLRLGQRVRVTYDAEVVSTGSTLIVRNLDYVAAGPHREHHMSEVLASQVEPIEHPATDPRWTVRTSAPATVNDDTISLAYIYVKVAPDQWNNAKHGSALRDSAVANYRVLSRPEQPEETS